MLVKQCHKPSPSHHHLYRWYVYHSQSWMVYDNALPTLNPLTLIIPVVSNLDSMDLWWPAAVSSPWSLVFYPLVNKQFAIENAHRNNSMVELSIVFCMFTRGNHMEVSWNGGTPESSIFMGFSIINENLDPSFMETPIFLSTKHVLFSSSSVPLESRLSWHRWTSTVCGTIGSAQQRCSQRRRAGPSRHKPQEPLAAVGKGRFRWKTMVFHIHVSLPQDVCM